MNTTHNAVPVRSRVDPERINILRDGPINGPVVYWMNRDQRTADNWALLHAADCARQSGAPLLVIFCYGQRLEKTVRQVRFMEKGLREVRRELERLNLSFFESAESAKAAIPRICTSIGAGLLVTDFFPLREYRRELKQIVDGLSLPVHSVDAHNIVPCRIASTKEEVGARTLRPKIDRLLSRFLTEFPVLERHPSRGDFSLKADEGGLKKYFGSLDGDATELNWLTPGEKSAHKALSDFLEQRLAVYHENRNDPVLTGQSDLSPYLHFGMLSAQRVALEVDKSSAPPEAKNAFLEELIVRRELSDNFCLYNKAYDSMEGFSRWARASLNEHRKDERDQIYSIEAFEEARTGDPLWNAAQKQLIRYGKIHGYMRMYWAKKMLEWLPTPEIALREALRLNDKYSLDGNDPNGFTGVAWSIGGIHDRAWFDRPVYGKIRYMNSNGAASKFDVAAYIANMDAL